MTDYSESIKQCKKVFERLGYKEGIEMAYESENGLLIVPVHDECEYGTPYIVIPANGGQPFVYSPENNDYAVYVNNAAIIKRGSGKYGI